MVEVLKKGLEAKKKIEKIHEIRLKELEKSISAPSVIHKQSLPRYDILEE